MLYEFLEANRADLIERCRAKVARRTAPPPTPNEMEHGIPLFLEQLIETLRDEGSAAGPSPGRWPGRDLPAEISMTAARHGRELLEHGFTVNQVVHDYGDLCQAVADLATENEVPVSNVEFRTLNRCLDNAIADAVSEFDRQRDRQMSESSSLALSERLGSLAHEMRNYLNTAILGFAALKSGRVAVQGATSSVVDRSLAGLRDLVDRALADVRMVAGVPARLDDFVLGRFIGEVEVAASLEARARECELTTQCTPQGLHVRADRQLLFSAVSNLLQNAFKFTHPGSRVRLHAYEAGDRVRIDVQDECGGLPEGKADSLFRAFEQHGADRTGLGLGLSIARRAVEASGGTIHVRDLPGVGCVFSIDLPAGGTQAGAPEAQGFTATAGDASRA